jgi:hypothetical protein
LLGESSKPLFFFQVVNPAAVASADGSFQSRSTDSRVMIEPTDTDVDVLLHARSSHKFLVLVTLILDKIC